MNRTILAGIVISAATLACSPRSNSEYGNTLATAEPPSPEPVLDYEVTATALVVRVRSNGCTDKKSFTTDVYVAPERIANPVYQVTLNRARPDLCKAMLPDGEVLTWELRDLAIPDGAFVAVKNAPVVIVNPMGMGCRPENCDPM